jgi:hypothetical protein
MFPKDIIDKKQILSIDTQPKLNNGKIISIPIKLGKDKGLNKIKSNKNNEDNLVFDLDFLYS